MDGSRLSSVGTALADPSRAGMLIALGSGRAHTAGELAHWVGIAASTASRHLSQLVDAGLISVEASGRFRYFRIASEEVADLLEHIDSLELAETRAPRPPRRGTELSFARSCYDHLAGELAVRLYEGMLENDMLSESGGRLDLTDVGRNTVISLGVDLDPLVERRRPVVRPCLDWTERRHHLGGSLGAALLDHFLVEGWLQRGTDRRVLLVRRSGAKALHELFGVAATHTASDGPVRSSSPQS